MPVVHPEVEVVAQAHISYAFTSAKLHVFCFWFMYPQSSIFYYLSPVLQFFLHHFPVLIHQHNVICEDHGSGASSRTLFVNTSIIILYTSDRVSVDVCRIVYFVLLQSVISYKATSLGWLAWGYSTVAERIFSYSIELSEFMQNFLIERIAEIHIRVYA